MSGLSVSLARISFYIAHLQVPLKTDTSMPSAGRASTEDIITGHLNLYTVGIGGQHIVCVVRILNFNADKYLTSILPRNS